MRQWDSSRGSPGNEELKDTAEWGPSLVGSAPVPAGEPGKELGKCLTLVCLWREMLYQQLSNHLLLTTSWMASNSRSDTLG